MHIMLMVIRAKQWCAAALFLLSIFMASAAYAASPQKIMYQGTLRRANSPYTGNVTFVFRITDQAGGTEYWTSGSTVVAVTGGMFRYPIGETNTGGDGGFPAITWASITPYVEVTSDGTTLLPREPLVSVPYALSATGDNLGDHTATQDLSMASWNLVNVSSVNFLSNVFMSSATAAQNGGVYVSSSLYVNGAATIGKFIVQAADSGISVSAADFGKTITVNSASAQTVTLPSVTAADIGATITVIKLGAGKVTIQAGASSYIADSSSGGTLYNNAVTPAYATITLRLIYDGANYRWMLIGGEGAWITT